MLVFGSSARVLKPSGCTILFYHKKSFPFYNHKGIAIGFLTIGLHAFLCTHFSLFFLFLFFQEVKVGWEKVAVFTT